MPLQTRNRLIVAVSALASALAFTAALVAALVAALGAPFFASAQGGASGRPSLSKSDVDEIINLEHIEDRRDFDARALQRIAKAQHPELRRRAALAIARLYDPRGRELLRSMRSDSDTAVLATVVWATGQLVDTSAVAWLDSLLGEERTPVGVATEAAGAFGKIRTSDTRLRLSLYLSAAAPGPARAPVVAEALLSIGRHSERGDISSITRWAESPDAELRWRAVWALWRPGDPEAVPALLQLSSDPSAEVRSWAVRGLTGPRSDSSGLGSAIARDALLAALDDDDRRVATNAVRTLGTHSDAPSLLQLVLLLDEPDPWIATTAADAIGARGDNARGALGPLANATSDGHSPWVRAAALIALTDVGLSAALYPATAMATDTSLVVRTAAVGVLTRLKVGGLVGLETMLSEPDRGVRRDAHAAYLALVDTLENFELSRAARKQAFTSRDVAVRAGAAKSMATPIAAWADSSDIPMLLDAFAVALRDSAAIAQDAVIETLAEIESRGGNAAAAFFAKYRTAPSEIVYGMAGRAFGFRTLAAWGTGRPIRSARTNADYKRIVETLIVPAYNGEVPPRLRWETTRGDVDTELNPLDTPLATDYLLSLVKQGAMRNIRFDRVVPNFVAQQREVLIDEPLQRDEISRGRLVRGNLSWGSNIGNSPMYPGRGRGPGAAYDTGPAVYVFAHTPQPHNEGDFAALGRIVNGMDVADLMQLGDYVKSVRVLKPGEK
ncbi:MAG: HEAT repeat domain-containing protein [Gemmatimonadetes bacterium]|nr:HEAT repeat domain-containing protein [Gemmatimonadota bacterium]